MARGVVSRTGFPEHQVAGVRRDARWFRKARRLARWNGSGQIAFNRVAMDLARDIWRTLDPEGYKKEARRG